MFKTVEEIKNKLSKYPVGAKVILGIDGKLYEQDYQIKTIEKDAGVHIVYITLSNDHYPSSKGEQE